MFFFKKKRIPEILTAWANKNGFDCANINSRIDNGMTALMHAAQQGDQGVVRILLQGDCNVNLVNTDENNALWFACVSKNQEIVRYLTSFNCDVNNQNVNGATCLMYSASNGEIEIVKALIKAGADINKHTKDGFTALDSATTLPILKYLKPIYKNA